MTTNDLLRRYVADQSETAFAELVQQHIALVYSAALRQVNGDVPAAQDVTQAVFTDLARKAPGLTRHTSLTGWLYTSTRYLAAKTRRAEQSRRSREQEAHDMNELLHSTESDPTWQELRPLLDEAMHDLSATDREAVLLRYFERRSLVEIGAEMGLTDKAAHMRVERAIDRLRAALAKRGVTSTITALAAVLTARAVGVVPAGLAAQVSGAALATVAAGGAVGWGLLKLAGLLKAPAVIGVGAVAVVAGLIMAPQLWERNRATTTSPMQAQLAPAAVPTNVVAQPPVAASVTPSNVMVLHIVADDTGEPIPRAVIYVPGRRTGPGPTGIPPMKLAVADELGMCQIPVTQDPPGWLMFITRTTNGFVDEQVTWNPNIGKIIPSQYTVRLERAVPIGGVVVDEDGQPVAGAAIEFDEVTHGKEPDDSPEAPRISYTVGFAAENGGPSAATDATGHWHSDKVGREDLEKIHFRATNPDYIAEPRMGGAMRNSPELEKQFMSGTYTSRLTKGLRLTGVIVDTAGHPVTEAKVSDRYLKVNTMGSATTNLPDGSFILSGCRPGTNQLHVEARGFAYTILDVDLAADTAPLRIVLQPGYVLRLRVLDTNGLPLPRRVNPNVDVDSSPGTVLHILTANADTDGRVVWESAPDREMHIDVHAQGMLPVTNLVVQADGEGHLVTLTTAAASSVSPTTAPRVAITGTVSDAATRLAIPHFRIIYGNAYSAVVGVTNVHWEVGRFFDDGKFQFGDQPGSRSGPPLSFKFEADGYAPFVTRFVRAEEGEVTFNIALQRAASITVSVLSPDGQPATNADIGLDIPGNALRLSPGALWNRGPSQSFNLFKTDSEGRVTLPPDPSVVRVIAANEEGYGEASAAGLATQPTLRLQPWGRLEGDYFVGGKPAAGRTLTLADERTPASLYLDETDYSTTTDANGHFSFPKVPPGQFQLFHTNVVVRSGQTTTVELRANTVSVRLRWPDGVQPESNWETSVGIPGLDFKETSEGNWTAELPAGNRKLSAQVFALKPGDSRPRTYVTLFQGKAAFSVPDDATSGTLDLGEIQLEKAQ
jgi:RNA polymerase sigma factor (sigma-70 family)